MKKGFSLIELLISLVVISIIAAALTPIMTKKMSKSNMVVKVAQAKKGLQIYTNPGTYAFDVPENVNTIYISGAAGGGGGAGAIKTRVDKTFNSNTSWVVPKGVNSITLTVTGSGGGGGAANGIKDTLCTHLQNCRSDEFLAMRANDDEKDVCIMKRNASKTSIGKSNLSAGENCAIGDCCWMANYACTSGNGNYSGCNRAVCTTQSEICNFYNPDNYSHTAETLQCGRYGMPSLKTLQDVKKYLYEWSLNASSNGLQLCSANWLPIVGYNDGTNLSSNVPICENVWSCTGVTNSYCHTGTLIGSGAALEINGTYSYSGVSGFTNSSLSTGSIRCSKVLSGYKGFQGAGGASGAQYTETVSVLPGDTFTITIGAGGTGGVTGVSKNNGTISRTGNGTQGQNTQLVHKRGATVLNTYRVKGGYGGLGATTSANGETLTTTTPLGTCYANGDKNCSVQSFSGSAGSSQQGGNGARVANTGTITLGQGSSGGYTLLDSRRGAYERCTKKEAHFAMGQAATQPGFGGGGGFTPKWANNNATTSSGGVNRSNTCVDKDSGLYSATYTSGYQHFFSGGGGANGKVDISYDVVTPGGGGGAGASASEIEYKVTGGQRLVFTIGKGGDGGVASQIGKAGNATTFMEQEIIFNAGLGGSFGVGGNAGAFKINTSKAKFNGTGVGSAGEKGQNNDYGFDGGSGGTSFLGYFGGCGGGVIADLNLERACQAMPRDGASARTHNAVKNEYGGQGGGGGGVTTTSSELGKGGDGADGYLRIRWGEE